MRRRLRNRAAPPRRIAPGEAWSTKGYDASSGTKPGVSPRPRAEPMGHVGRAFEATDSKVAPCMAKDASACPPAPEPCYCSLTMRTLRALATAGMILPLAALGCAGRTAPFNEMD